jgi:hypothetical protein
LFLLTSTYGLRAQQPDTVYMTREKIVYDTVTVHDTLHVRDTLFINNKTADEEPEEINQPDGHTEFEEGSSEKNFKKQKKEYPPVAVPKHEMGVSFSICPMTGLLTSIIEGFAGIPWSRSSGYNWYDPVKGTGWVQPKTYLYIGNLTFHYNYNFNRLHALTTGISFGDKFYHRQNVHELFITWHIGYRITYFRREKWNMYGKFGTGACFATQAKAFTDDGKTHVTIVPCYIISPACFQIGQHHAATIEISASWGVLGLVNIGYTYRF